MCYKDVLGYILCSETVTTSTGQSVFNRAYHARNNFKCTNGKCSYNSKHITQQSGRCNQDGNVRNKLECSSDKCSEREEYVKEHINSTIISRDNQLKTSETDQNQKETHKLIDTDCAVKKVNDGIKELKEILGKIMQEIGYPFENTKRTQNPTKKNSKRKKRQKPKYFHNKKAISKPSQCGRKLAIKRSYKARKRNIVKKKYNASSVIQSKSRKSNQDNKNREFFLQLLMTTWFKDRNYFIKHKRKGIGFSSVLLKNLRPFISQLRQEQYPITIYPVHKQSLNTYFETLSLENRRQNTTDSMTYEWFRFASFAAYPENIPVRPIRLAASGFYYTGTGDEVKCFSCGVIYKNWKSGDDAMDVHRRISPNCNHIRNDGSNNVAVSNNQQNSSDISARQPDETENTPMIVPNRQDISANQVQTETASNETNVTPEPSEQQQHTHSGGVDCSNEQNVCQHTQHNITTSTPERHESQLQTQKISIERLDPLGINFEKPKYPAFAVLAVRISTFQKWPAYLTQTPREMALAGLMYIGEADYCRCFFCGGGMRHWEAGDDPWVEHARWFPKCYFVRQNKGDAFVSLVLQRQAELEQQSVLGAEASNQIPGTTQAEVTNYPEQQDNKPNLRESDLNSKDHDEDELNFPAALSVLDMGYSRDQVKQAIRIIKDQQRRKPLKASDILNTIFTLENDDGQQSVGAEISNTQLGQDQDEILRENQQLKEQRLCRICKDEEANIAFLPCGHLVCCGDCAPAMRDCPVCQEFVRGTVKTYLV